MYLSLEKKWFVFCVVVCFLFFAQSIRANEKEFIIVTKSMDKQKIALLKESLDAQLVDYHYQTKIVVVSQQEITNDDLGEFANTAKKISSKEHSGAVLFLSKTHLYLFFTEGPHSSLVSRPLPSENSDWELQCDLIATVVQSMLFSWIHNPAEFGTSSKVAEKETPENKVTDSTKEETKQKTLKSKDINQLQDLSHLKPPDSTRDTDSKKLNFRYGVGVHYVPMTMSAQNRWVNGIQVGAYVFLSQYLGLSILPGFRSVKTKNYRLNRVPLRVSVQLMYPKNKLRFGGETAIVFEPSAIRKLNGELVNQGKMTYLGVGFSFNLLYRISKWLDVVMAAGLNMYSTSNRYLGVQNQVIFDYGPIQGRWVLGTILGF